MSGFSPLPAAFALVTFTAAACAPFVPSSQDVDALVQQGLQTAQAQMTAEAGSMPSPAAQPADFSPSLDALDHFVRSVSITEQ